MTTTFGARLRTQREEKGVSLDDISRHTKIKVSLLDALERNDLTYWPRGLFGRAYLRSYAQAIGLDAEPLLTEYLQLHPDPPEEFWMPASAETGFSSAIRSAVGAIPGLLRRTDRAERTETSPTSAAAPSSARLIATMPPVETPDTPEPRQEEIAVSEPPMTMAPVAEQPAASVAEQPAAPAQIAVLAELCTRIQQADHPRQLLPVLGAVAQMLEAKGLILWLWDSTAAGLKPWLSHGYSSHLVAQLPCVRREDDNAIAASFRTADACIVDKGSGDTGAIVVPLIGNSRCLGALALELREGAERRPFVHDAAIVVATLLAPFADAAPFPASATA